jgi:beta-lactamase class A
MASNPSVQRRSKPKSRRRKTLHQPQQWEVSEIDSPQQRQYQRSASLFIHLVRLIILGLGSSAIAGTIISVVNPTKQPIATKVAPPVAKSTPLPLDLLKLTRSSSNLQDRLQAGILQGKGSTKEKKHQLDPSYLFVEIDSGEYSELGADRVLPAASTIKLPILIALFQDVDAQKVQLEEKLTIDKRSIAEGSGDLQEQKPGTQVSILVAATKMMTISDNTATNLLIDRLGGSTVLNQRFRKWGLKVTTINHSLPDLGGTNVTTAKELARSMMAIDRGKIVSDSSRSQILSMMSNTIRNTMLPKGLGAGAKIAHKTGDIGSLIADVGSIELPSGKTYIAAVLVKRPYNDPAGPELVRQMSKIAYEYFQPPLPTSSSQPHPKIDPGFPHTVFIKKRL